MNLQTPTKTLLAILLLVLATSGQTETKHAGIALYEQGKYPEAIKSLESAVSKTASDGLLWNYLGLSQLENGDLKKSIKSLQKAIALDANRTSFRINLGYAFLRNQQTDKAQNELEKALKIEPNNVQALYLHGVASLWEKKTKDAISNADRIILIDPKFVDAYILKADALLTGVIGIVADSNDEPDLRDALRQAISVLNAGISTCDKCKQRSKLIEELEAKNAFHEYYSSRGTVQNSAQTALVENEPGVTPLKIISKPRASYTDKARQNNTQGKIKLAVLFGASGRIEYVMFLSRLGSGLDENVMRAARSIKFEPKTKDGKPVSVVRVIEYGFSIY